MPRQGFVIAERYRLDSEIAAGATGLIWRATDLRQQQEVAVKVLHPEYARIPVLLERFRAAMRAVGDLGHQGVVKIYDYGDEGPSGAPYVVTDLIDGPSLAEVVSSGAALPASFIAAALGRIAAGLAAAHRAGLVHGDLKPSDILFTPGPGHPPVITDFGITYALSAIPRGGNTPGTAHGTGTAAYLAPERVSGDPGAPASDLYSLGMIAHEWLTGWPPFTGTPQQVISAHRRNPVPTLPWTVPGELAGLISRLTAKDPAQRPGDAGEVASALDDMAQQLSAGDDERLFPASASWGGSPLADTRPQRALSGPFPLLNDAADDPAEAGRVRAWAELVTETRPQEALTGPLPLLNDSADDPAEAGRPGPRSGLAAHKREIAWAASAVAVAGLLGWTASGPIQGAAKIANPSGPSELPSPTRTASPPGQGGGVQTQPPAASVSPATSGPGHAPASGTSSPGATRTARPEPAPPSATSKPTVSSSPSATPPPATAAPSPSGSPSVLPTSSTPPPTSSPSAPASPTPSPAASLLAVAPATPFSLRVNGL